MAAFVYRAISLQALVRQDDRILHEIHLTMLDYQQWGMLVPLLSALETILPAEFPMHSGGYFVMG